MIQHCGIFGFTKFLPYYYPFIFVCWDVCGCIMIILMYLGWGSFCSCICFISFLHGLGRVGGNLCYNRFLLCLVWGLTWCLSYFYFFVIFFSFFFASKKDLDGICLFDHMAMDLSIWSILLRINFLAGVFI